MIRELTLAEWEEIHARFVRTGETATMLATEFGVPARMILEYLDRRLLNRPLDLQPIRERDDQAISRLQMDDWDESQIGWLNGDIDRRRLLGEIDRIKGAIRELHYEVHDGTPRPPTCCECDAFWPCPTIEDLGGAT